MRLLFLAPLCIATSACAPLKVSDANFNFPSPPDELMKTPAELKLLKDAKKVSPAPAPSPTTNARPPLIMADE